jgi:hypothetical protein
VFGPGRTPVDASGPRPYVDGDDPDTVLVVMDMASIDRAREFAGSAELASARLRAGAVGLPDGVWYGPAEVR